MDDNNTAYEKLVSRFYQGMLNYDGFENIRVEHNVTLTGKSGATHQIDVFWEFKAAGTIYKTCVECKNYASAVKKSHVAAFAEILRDIGNANGIIATTSSYQKGAKLLAKENHIRLVQVNDLLKRVSITTAPKQTIYSNSEINFNEESIREALIRNNLKEYNANYEIDGDQPLLDKDGNIVETFNSLVRKRANTPGLNYIKDVNLYFDIQDLGPVLIDSISIQVSSIDLPVFETVVEMPSSEIAVIEDILNKNVHYLHDDGKISE